MSGTLVGTGASGRRRTGRVRRWLLADRDDLGIAGPHAADAVERERHPWWRVGSLTGVDYFSTLGYQPGIAFVAAGLLSPVATLVVVAITLFGALPIYRRVAAESPNGQGSLTMLERLLPKWKGKLLVLALLGFVATDFVITMTLSGADATAHLVENPFAPEELKQYRVAVTVVLMALLGAVFLIGFTEAVGIATVLVGAFLLLNLVVILVAFAHIAADPAVVTDWRTALLAQHANPLMMVAAALLVFPRLALGLSGFETGVAVMPLVKGCKDDDPAHPRGRIRGTRRMLTVVAVVMSAFLVTSSFTTAVLIPPAEFGPGGAANGRALAYLAHAYLGDGFGTLYDIATIAILWFAGASAMAGLLNIVPRYLPRYGMAPDWTRAVRPLVLVFTGVAILVTVYFRADVGAQGGAYATGVLVLILSAAIAVTLSAHRRGRRGATVAFGLITLVFAYTTVVNVIERPDGVKLASMFILAIVALSFVSRATRSTELRSTRIRVDARAREFLDEAAHHPTVFIANEPGPRDAAEYRDKDRETRRENLLEPDQTVLFIEVTVDDASEFSCELRVEGEERHGYRILRLRGSTIANSIAAFLLHVRDESGHRPHVYFNWLEGNPALAIMRYLAFGSGDIAPMAREVLRQAEPDPSRRPLVHVD